MENGKDGPNSGTRKDAGLKSGWGDSTRREGEFRRARGRKSGGEENAVEGHREQGGESGG